MKISTIANANTKKKDVAFYELECPTELESKADEFLESQGVDLSLGEVDRLDGYSYITFLVELNGIRSKAKELKSMREALKKLSL